MTRGMKSREKAQIKLLTWKPQYLKLKCTYTLIHRMVFIADYRLWKKLVLNLKNSNKNYMKHRMEKKKV